MGATFPALLRAVSDSPERARRFVGALYALNLTGAVAGTLVTGLVLIESVGLRGSTLAAAALNIAVGGAILLARRSGWHPTEGALKPEQIPGESLWATLGQLVRSRSGIFILLGLFVSGATTMAYEVVLTRVLGSVFGVSTYAFTIVLSCFLLGLGLGALAYERWLRGRAARPTAFAWSQVAVAAAGSLLVAAIPTVPRLVLYLRQIPGLGFTGLLTGKALIAAGLLLPLATLAGLGMPLLLAALAGDVRRIGRSVGSAYLVNTFGTIAGALGAGFVLIAALGTEGTLRATVAASAAVGFLGIVALAPSRRARVAGGLLAAAALAAPGAVPRWPAALFLRSDSNEFSILTTPLAVEERLRASPAELLFLREGRNATVAVTQGPGGRVLVVNGHPDASDEGDMWTQIALTLVPLAAHPRPERVLVVGFGSGVTAGTALRFPEVRHLDVVEIERAVVEAAPFFRHVNGGVERDPRTHLVIDDGRSYVLATRERFDVVISEPSNVWRAGVANLFTAEFYAGARRLLLPGGVFAQWMQLYRVDFATLRTVLKTVSEAFPETQLWLLDGGNVIILGADAPIVLDRTRVDGLLDGEFRAERVRIGRIGSVPEFYSRHLLDRHGIRSLLQMGARANTDDRPVLEFRAPRGLMQPTGRNAERLLAAKLDAGLAPPPLVGTLPRESDLWLGVAAMYGGTSRTTTAEVREALKRSLAGGAPPLARVRAAELALNDGDVDGAARLLEGIEAPAGSGDLQRELAYARAHLLAVGGRIEAALAAYRESGEYDGEAGLEALAVLLKTHHVDGALELAERLLSVARPGGAVSAPGVDFIYKTLVKMAGQEGPDFAARALDLTLRLPAADDFARFPRLKAVALLSQRVGKPREARAACLEASRVGVIDLQLMMLHARLLRDAGRAAQADELEREIAALTPEAAASAAP